MNSTPPRETGIFYKLARRAWRSERRILRWLPSVMRCKVCWLPFQGPFSVPFKIVQMRPSRKNPSMCTN